MRVIGAGYGRTGTMTLKAALEQLGAGPCFHMIDLIRNETRVDLWSAAVAGEAVDWHAVFEGWGATVDWPGCSFYQPLMEVFPDAKVLLTVRDPDAWYESCRRTIHAAQAAIRDGELDGGTEGPPSPAVMNVIAPLIWDGEFEARFEDREFAIGVFNGHNEEVREHRAGGPAGRARDLRRLGAAGADARRPGARRAVPAPQRHGGLPRDDGHAGAAGVAMAEVTWEPAALSRAERWRSLDLHARTVWLTGLPGAGKSTLAGAVERALVRAGRPAYRLDGDNLRHGICSGLGFSSADRDENVRRAGEIAHLFADAGVIAIVALVSPFAEGRRRARALHERDGLGFVEVFLDTPVSECARRDPKHLYERARAGEVTGLTGVDAPYERPAAPELVIRPELGLERSVALVLAALAE